MVAAIWPLAGAPTDTAGVFAVMIGIADAGMVSSYTFLVPVFSAEACVSDAAESAGVLDPRSARAADIVSAMDGNAPCSRAWAGS